MTYAEKVEFWVECLEQAIEEMDSTGLTMTRALELYHAQEDN